MKKYEMTLRKAEIGKMYEEFEIVGVENNNLVVKDTDDDNEISKYSISKQNKVVNGVVYFRISGSSRTAQSIGERIVVEFECEDNEVNEKENEIFGKIGE